ncbi:hypothetical protein B9Z55_001414 [Caenorhabditis nigoni]|uniref:Uncharacterized protein n=1 Tax=Caenorhabditis nigoni TaxID=1611254 RepID=A0A2G5VFN3_9PELO|nr:hypothetical protein B9Z55_001414 [Caenorhabditis nigoni]
MSAPSRVIELTPEDHDLCQTDETDGTKRFPVNRDIQEEIMEFIKKKLLDSIELQQFLVSREIDFHEKYIDSLANRDDQRNYNNHNDLEEHGQGEMSDEEKEKTLNYCRTQLIGLKKRLECLGRREQKACDYLSSPIRQLNILCSSETENHYKITNKSWITIVNSSITLQKIKLICEKLTEVEMEIEKIFWSTEVGNLVEKLEGSQKEVALEIILEMVNWASGISAKNNLVSLVRHLIDKSETREKVFKTLEQPNIAQFSVVEDYILSIKTYVAILLALKIVS